MLKDQKRTLNQQHECSKAYRTLKTNKNKVYITYEQLNHTYGMYILYITNKTICKWSGKSCSITNGNGACCE